MHLQKHKARGEEIRGALLFMVGRNRQIDQAHLPPEAHRRGSEAVDGRVQRLVLSLLIGYAMRSSNWA